MPLTLSSIPDGLRAHIVNDEKVLADRADEKKEEYRKVPTDQLAAQSKKNEALLNQLIDQYKQAVAQGLPQQQLDQIAVKFGEAAALQDALDRILARRARDAGVAPQATAPAKGSQDFEALLKRYEKDHGATSKLYDKDNIKELPDYLQKELKGGEPPVRLITFPTREAAEQFIKDAAAMGIQVRMLPPPPAMQAQVAPPAASQTQAPHAGQPPRSPAFRELGDRVPQLRTDSSARRRDDDEMNDRTGPRGPGHGAAS